MKSHKKAIAGLAAFATATAGFAALGITQAQAITNSPTLNSAPISNLGTVPFGPQTATLTAVQNLTNVDLTITMATGPQATASAAAAGSYQYEFDIADTSGAGTLVLSGDQCQTSGSAATHTAVAQNAFYPGIGGTSTIPALVCTVVAPPAGVRTYEIVNMNVQSNGPSSGSSLDAPRTGFDANVNSLAAPALPANLDANKVPIPSLWATSAWGVAEPIDVDLRTLTVNSTTLQSNPIYGRGEFIIDTNGPVAPGGEVTIPGNTVTLAFNNEWGGGSASVELCNSGSTTVGCQTVGSVTLTAATAGTATVVLPAALTTGLRSLVVTDPANNTKKIKTAYNVLGARTVTLSPTGGGPGQLVTVSGQNWNTGEAGVTLSSVTAAFAPSGETFSAISVSNTGVLSSSFTLTNTATSRVRGTSTATTPNDTAVSAAFTVNLDQCIRQTGTGATSVCETKQNINLTVNAGALRQDVADFDGTGTDNTTTSISFGAVTTAVASQTVGRNLNPITVTDARGGTSTWSLTAAMPNLVAPGGTLANGNMAIGTRTCVGTAESATGQSVGTEATFAGGVTLCNSPAGTVTDSDGGNNGGQWVVNAPLTLTVPAFQVAGAYTSTITVTLT